MLKVISSFIEYKLSESFQQRSYKINKLEFINNIYGQSEHDFGYLVLTLKATITTAADDIHKYFFFFFFRENKT